MNDEDEVWDFVGDGRGSYKVFLRNDEVGSLLYEMTDAGMALVPISEFRSVPPERIMRGFRRLGLVGIAAIGGVGAYLYFASQGA